MTPEQLSDALVAALTRLVDAGRLTLPDGVPTEVRVERPKVKEHGDYATNVALQLAKKAGVNPRDLAQWLADELVTDDGVAAAEIAGPGFLNLRVAAGAQGAVAARVLEAGDAYGRSDLYAGQRVNLEFVSANPTGPIHIGGVRW
ncbi:MAG: arginine--tRNA ligase, partial [Aeromicrobium erythreum]